MPASLGLQMFGGHLNLKEQDWGRNTHHPPPSPSHVVGQRPPSFRGRTVTFGEKEPGGGWRKNQGAPGQGGGQGGGQGRGAWPDPRGPQGLPGAWSLLS